MWLGKHERWSQTVEVKESVQFAIIEIFSEAKQWDELVEQERSQA